VPPPDSVPSLLVRVRGLWEQLADAPGAFTESRPLNVVVSPESRMCPRSWVGIVAVGSSALVTAPTERLADRLRAALAGLAVPALTEATGLRSVLPIADVLGPATLAYLAAEEFQPHDHHLPVEALSADHDEVARLIAGVPLDEAGESGIGKITSPAFVVRHEGEVAAAAGYQDWLGTAAHLSVLTAERMRGRGLARVAASAATRHALERRLLPQWRARPAASRRVARALGFRELGVQLSIRVDG